MASGGHRPTRQDKAGVSREDRLPGTDRADVDILTRCIRALDVVARHTGPQDVGS